MTPGAAYDAIMAYVADLQIIDTHEHLPPFEAARDSSLDGLQEYIMDYFNRDLVSAGMPLADMHRVKTERPCRCWRVGGWLRPTGSWRATPAMAVRWTSPRVGYTGWTASTRTPSRRWMRRCAPVASLGHYDIVLKQKSKIAISLLDGDWPSDPRFFRNMLNLDAFVVSAHPGPGARDRGGDRGAHLRL